MTQFWLVESSTINPKLYSVGVLLSFHGNDVILLNVLEIKNHTTFSYNSWIIGTRDFENSQIVLEVVRFPIHIGWT